MLYKGKKGLVKQQGDAWLLSACSDVNRKSFSDKGCLLSLALIFRLTRMLGSEMPLIFTIKVRK